VHGSGNIRQTQELARSLADGLPLDLVLLSRH
jgi:hypothetical protein